MKHEKEDEKQTAVQKNEQSKQRIRKRELNRAFSR